MWKWFLGLLVISVSSCGMGGYFIAQSPGFQELITSMRPGEKATEVRLGKVELGNLVKTVNAPGTIEPKTKVQISAQVAARVTALPFREGERVKAGDVLVRLDSREFLSILESTQASKRSEEARLSSARAAFTLAEQELTRQRELSRTGDTARSRLEAAESEFQRAKSSVEASTHSIAVADANISRARKDLENCEIVAPNDGVVIKLNVEVGELVLVGTFNNAGSVIMEVADLDLMLLKARVDEANIVPVQKGQRATVFVNAYKGRRFVGTVEKVGLKRIVDRDGTGYYEVEVLVEKPQGEILRSGLQANVDIEVETLYDVLRVPTQAILDRRIDELPAASVDASTTVDRTKSFARVVYVMDGGKAKSVPVSVGSSDLTHTVIIAGLSADQPVVTGPFKVLQDLRDGKNLAEEKPKNGPKGDSKPGVAGGGKGHAGSPG
ncbi:MAG: efflux RND transporter periplasmic adaptor subunit [Phycisphaerales bacterium]